MQNAHPPFPLSHSCCTLHVHHSLSLAVKCSFSLSLVSLLLHVVCAPYPVPCCTMLISPSLGSCLLHTAYAPQPVPCCAVLVQHKVNQDGSTEPELTPCAQAQGDRKDQLRRLIGKAKEDWKATDHPNWSIRDMDSADFLDSHMLPGQVGPTTLFPLARFAVLGCMARAATTLYWACCALLCTLCCLLSCRLGQTLSAHPSFATDRCEYNINDHQ